MRVVVIRHKPCQQFYMFLEGYRDNLEYLGFSLQRYGIVHYFKANGKVIHLPCKDCVLRQLLGAAPLVDHPRFEDGVFVFKFLYTRALAKRLKIKEGQWHSSYFTLQLVSLRRVLLTSRQKKAFRLFATGGLRKVAESLGVSKPTACRLVKRALQKLAYQLS
jgi:predicted DNA-binding protein (UPF0251 family)